MLLTKLLADPTTPATVLQGLWTTQRALSNARAEFERGTGIGRDAILRVLDGVPGITQHVVEAATPARVAA